MSDDVYIPSAYKNRRIPWKGQLCAVCGLQTRGKTTELHLTYGVSFWVCQLHGSEAFQTMRSGRDFVATIARVMQSCGRYNRKVALALDAHLKRISPRKRRTDPDDLPGSYAWPALRRETEQRLQKGESFERIATDICARHAHDIANAPTRRTMRRWFADGHWRSGRTLKLPDRLRTRDPAKAARAQRPVKAVRQHLGLHAP